jgi:hypothetical protein
MIQEIPVFEIITKNLKMKFLKQHSISKFENEGYPA